MNSIHDVPLEQRVAEGYREVDRLTCRLPAVFAGAADSHRLLARQIVRRWSCTPGGKDPTIHSQWFKAMFGNGYCDDIDAAQRMGMVETSDPTYQVGMQSRRFCLGPAAQGNQWQPMVIDDRRLMGRYNKFRFDRLVGRARDIESMNSAGLSGVAMFDEVLCEVKLRMPGSLGTSETYSALPAGGCGWPSPWSVGGLSRNGRCCCLFPQTIERILLTRQCSDVSPMAVESTAMLIREIYDGSTMWSRCRFGRRLHWAGTRLMRELRPFLMLAGDDDLIEIDVKCSQLRCLELALFQPKRAAQISGVDGWPACAARVTAGDLERFRSDLGGDIYNLAAMELGMTRDSAKPALLKFLFDIWFPDYELVHSDANRRTMYSWFRERYPSVFDCFAAAKWLPKYKRRKRHASLAMIAQRIESYLVIETVLNRLLKSTMALPIHDSIIVARRDAGRVEQLLVEAFDRFGVSAQTEQTCYADKRKEILGSVFG